MASIDCMKCTSGQAGGLSVHFDYEKRLESEHSNPHIDKSKTHLNSFYDCAGYPEMLHRQKKRVSEVDELHPPERFRKDRITAIMMEIPVPKSISDKGLTDQFLQDTYAMIGEMVGKGNMCGMTIHRDEVHDYIDHGGKVRTSLEHGHAMVVPYARWTAKETVYDEDGKPLRDKNGKIVKQEVKREGVNAKHFLTRNFLKKLQDNMQAMVLDKYGISYQTSQEPLQMAVEDLKRDSARAAAIIDRAEQEAARERQRAEEARQRVQAANAQAKALEGKNKALEDKLAAQQQRYDRNDAVIQDQEEALGLIKTVEEYQDEALDLLDTIDTAEAFASQELPVAAKFFKLSAADAFIKRMETLFDKLRKYVEVGIQRLRIYERTHVVEEPLSEPVQKRAHGLGETLTSAFSRFHEENGSKGNQTHQKDEKTK